MTWRARARINQSAHQELALPSPQARWSPNLWASILMAPNASRTSLSTLVPKHAAANLEDAGLMNWPMILIACGLRGKADRRADIFSTSMCSKRLCPASSSVHAHLETAAPHVKTRCPEVLVHSPGSRLFAATVEVG